MKAITFKTLRFLLNLSVFVYLIGAVFLTMIIVKKGIDEESTTFTISFATREDYKIDTTLTSVKEIKGGVSEAFLVTNDVGIKFKTDSRYIKTVFAVITSACFLYSFIILLLLRSFVNSLEKSHPFTKVNVKTLRIMGFMLICIEPLHSGLSYFMENLMNEYFIHSLPIRSVFGDVFYWLGYNLSKGNFLSSWLVGGLIILVIAEVFKQGIAIKEEQDLTI